MGRRGCAEVSSSRRIASIIGEGVWREARWFVYTWSQRSLKFYEEDRGGIGWIGVHSIARVPLL